MNWIRVRARISLLSSEQGGRPSPVRVRSYRPNHNFGAAHSREMDIGFIELAEEEALHPGDAVDRDIAFLARPGLSDILTPGRQWRIQEGGQLVGTGVVLEVLEP